MRMAVVCVLLALAPFAVWTARNWRVFHVFQPLAPRLANDPGERPNPGWERWVKTLVPRFRFHLRHLLECAGGQLDLSKLPSRAFDSPAQYAETAALAADYNSHGRRLRRRSTRALHKLAEERIAAHPLRYYLWLPLGRVADMWLRPRVENLPIDLDWWVYAHHHTETRIQLGVRGVECAVSAAGVCRAVAAAAILAALCWPTWCCAARCC